MLIQFISKAGTAVRSCLTTAIENEHIWPAFQPIVDIRSGHLRGFEVLARWTDPLAGEISPVDFIPVLEQRDLIDRLFNHLVRTACPVAATWPGQFFLAFNISPKQLIGEALPLELSETVRATGFPLERFQIEITESSLISDVEGAYARLRELDDMGIKVALDDFGTGYSSLARLEAFPFRKLKIDACFVRALDRDSSKRRIAAAIIGLGQSLGITVVAEGVETRQEEAVLRDLGCDLGQGWLYGKPQTKDEARRTLEMVGTVEHTAPPLDVSPFQQLHQLATLYKQAPVGLCFLDLNHRHVRVNDRFASIHNMTGSELEGKTISDVMSGPTLATVKRILNQSLLSDEPITENYVHGDRHLRVICTRVVDLTGEVIGFSGVSLDTEAPLESCQRVLEGAVAFRKHPPVLRRCPGCSSGSQSQFNVGTS
ncbi:EAL domain-containing protein [Hyphomicrobium sp. B1]|uniref:sensor domain-containing phosphodiesterase n=1 Tax=Hyphomicrobium sp. B1 TaxID=3075651 RepID=UPI003C2DD53B